MGQDKSDPSKHAPYCMLSLTAKDGVKIKEKIRTWKIDNTLEPKWNASFDSYSEGKHKHKKEVPHGAALPWIDVYATSRRLRVQVRLILIRF